MSKILIGGLVGGLIVFVWGAISHMVLPLGEAGIDMMPNEDAVLETMKTSLPGAGLYIFPGLDMKSHPSEAEQKAWEERYRTGPAGILVYRPVGGEAIAAAQLIKELLSNIAGALVAAFLLAKIAGGYGPRVAAVALLGLFAWLSIGVSYWNWYGFPSTYTLAEGVEQTVGWSLAGLAIAKIVKPAPPRA